ncbi:MAG: hypothetical protein KJ749_07870 [Planctomycetes bacterium]|nr:hypothetical protein [Planctomycetota bacterium]
MKRQTSTGCYADFTIASGTATVQTWYEPGVARSDDPLNPSGTAYYHTNHLGTTRLMSDAAGLPTGESVYSAFGELVAGEFHRYGYVGASGYQTHDDFPFMHVGYRYYDPATGRFLQRDPIGTSGGVNVYEYAENRPTIASDPSGLATTLNPPALAGAGFSAQEIVEILGCGAATFAAAKSWEEWNKHVDGVRRGKDLVRRLNELKKHLKKKRHKNAADKSIKEETAKIKGHEKEIDQKWPNGEPPRPAG